MNKESFVLYESVYKQSQILEKRLGKEAALSFINAIMEFGLYGVVPDEESDVWLYGFEQSITSIDCAKERRTKSIENGKKGGRPKIELDVDKVYTKKAELGTWKAVADFFGVSENTLKKFRDINPQKPQKLKNLNENENVNENENEKKLDFAGAKSSGDSVASDWNNF